MAKKSNTKSFKEDLNKRLKNSRFANLFDAERKLAELAINISEARDKAGLTQKQLAAKARITQQQLSKIENGFNSNIVTYLKVFNALNLTLELNRLRKVS